MAQQKNGNRKEGDGEKKCSSTVVLQVSCLCDGCTPRILDCLRESEGVETVKAERSSNKVTVIGAVDPAVIKEKLLKKTKKKVDLISPQIAPETMEDLKVQLICQDFIVMIDKIVIETKGVHELKVDKQALSEALEEELKKNVEIVPPKRKKDGNKGGENGGGSGKKKNKGGNGGGDGGNEANAGGGAKVKGNRGEVMVQPGFGYVPCYAEYIPAYHGYGHHPHPGWYDYEHPYGHGHGHHPEPGYGCGCGHPYGHGHRHDY